MKTEIWAHRGASAYAPENTIEAFALARDMKADGIELDVYLTADRRLAVIHDPRIERTSNGAGAVAEMTFPVLRQFDFSAGRAGYANVRIPALEEVYGLIYPTSMTVNVELKAAGDGFLDAVLKCEDDMKMNGRVIYSSFDHLSLEALLGKRPGARVAPLYGNNMAKPWDYAASFGAAALHPHYNQLHLIGDADYVGRSHARGVRVHPWTVDDENEMRLMFAAGVDAIITDKPDVARRILRETAGA